MNTFSNIQSASSTNVLVRPFSELCDAELVLLCQNRDERAFTELFKRHRGLVNGMLYKFASDWRDSADLSQEVFIRMWQGIPKLQNPRAFKSWLCQIVTHLFYDELRKSSRRLPAISLDSIIFSDDDNEHFTRDIPDHSARPDVLLERKYTQNCVATAINKLPEVFKTAMILRDLDDMTYEDISQITSTDIGTVKSRISRARTKVQRILHPDFGTNTKLSA